MKFITKPRVIVPVAITVCVAVYAQTVLNAESGILFMLPISHSHPRVPIAL